MADIYIKYTPVRRGLSGVEFLAGFLDEHFPNVTWYGFISDGISEYGKISGNGDNLNKALLSIEGRFSIAKLDEDQITGICKMVYNPAEPGPGETAQTFVEFMNSHGITVTDELAVVKKAKKFLFKEYIKKFLQPNNDNLSALTKSVILHLFYYDNLSAENKAKVDADTASLLNIYTESMCINSYHDMVQELQSGLSDYYASISSLDSKTTVEDAMGVEYPTS